MTIALPFPTYPAAHRTRTSRLARLTGLFRRHDRKAAQTVEHVGITEELPVIDPEPVTDPLNPAWRPFEPDRAPAHTYDELAASTPVRLDWQPESFTETWAKLTPEKLAEMDAEAAAGGAS